MVGGRQLASRRARLKSVLERDVTLMISLGEKSISGKCSVEFRSPDKGYFIAGTEAQIPLPALCSVFYNEGRIPNLRVDLSKTLIQSLETYREVLE